MNQQHILDETFDQCYEICKNNGIKEENNFFSPFIQYQMRKEQILTCETPEQIGIITHWKRIELEAIRSFISKKQPLLTNIPSIPN